MPANSVVMEGSDGGALTTPGRGRWELWRRCAATVRFENFKQKARDGFLRAGFAICDDDVMPVICPTCQTIFERSKIPEDSTKRRRQFETALAESLLNDHEVKSPRPFPARALRYRR
ncbi:hypothetical protein [Bradyrhizobium australiense]|uniref:Uncharacterized protein n=1 Tax=Bradyrhizobium australiense TaxID=2721161 RepID=A0A7Y4LYN0_9BRAD|nr:hypothetical protein [Bradyrhizobium australiense]NOJ43757.1 hypothetical protein [Bradyrhizobium australiense]